MVIAQTKRLYLRHFHVLDEKAMLGIFADPEVMQFSDYGVQDEIWVQNWIHECLVEYQRWGFGHYAVVEHQSKAVIGYCGLALDTEINGYPEVTLGYRLIRSAWGQGYATEAVQLTLEFAFNVLNLQRLIATIDPSNHASVRVAEKIGMRFEKEFMPSGYSHPDYVYSLFSKGDPQ